MFGLSFGEILVIGVVALVVLGPERLPKVARFIGMMLGRWQRYSQSLRQEFDLQMQASGLQDIKREFELAQAETQQQLLAQTMALEQQVQDLQRSLAQSQALPLASEAGSESEHLADPNTTNDSHAEFNRLSQHGHTHEAEPEPASEAEPSLSELDKSLSPAPPSSTSLAPTVSGTN